ncbi:MAG TPA: hypothetical protein DEQ61_18270 [Streptomyces sp.]|nr:hypothetical protein [Streptomyces sp.]
MSGWRSLRLKDLCIDTGQYGLNVSAEAYAQSGVRLLRTTDISSGILTSDESGVFVDTVSEERFILAAGDLILSRSGTPPGQSYLVRRADAGMTFAGYLVRFRPRSNTDPRFLAYTARSDPFQETIQAESVSSTIQNFNAERYANIRCKAPDITQQRRIADFLDGETTRIDRLMDARHTQSSKLEEHDYSYVSETLVPGTLKNSGKGGMYPWLPELPTDRPLVRLGHVCQIQNGLTVDGKRDVSGDAVTRPYLRVANVQAGHVLFDSVAEITVPRAIADRSTLRPGDVLMTEGGDLDKLGRGAVWNGELPGCLHQNHIFALRPFRSDLDGEYLALMTQTLHGRCYFESTGSKTTNLASTNSSKILSFPIPLPTIEIQRDLTSQVQKRLQATTALRKLLGRQLALLTERRQALITAAVTGQFDVSTASGRNVTEGLSA